LATLKVMRCSRCQAENRKGLRYCEDCGARLAITCPSCGAEVTPGKKFCGSCGTPLATAQPESRYASPQTYTPKHLAEKIIASKAALEGERKQVTVLFADLKGSMELLADRDPEEARKVLDPVLELMMEAVHHYEGTVNQVMGDGIMALFGAPLAHEDHAVRACYAALRMQELVKRYAEEARHAHGVNVQIRVGLNSGEVVVRAIGSDLHMDYTAVGQTTHLAARLEQLATAGTTLVSPHTLELAEGWVEVKPLGPVPVKGLAEPVEVYELTAAAAARSRLQATAGRGLTRFVGRTAEIDQLSQALDLAFAGHGQVVAVVGEPGVGKSRLYWEFTRSHRIQGWLLVESASVSYGKAAPYLLVIDALKAYFQIEGRDDTRKVREKVTGKLLSLDRALEPVLPALLSLLDVPVEDGHWEQLDPRQRRQRILEGVRRLLLRESQVQPLVVIFEDLHWSDAETQVVLDALVESLPAAHVLLLVNYRPEYQHGWGSKSYYRQLRIDSLPPTSADELLISLLGEDHALEPLKRLLIERTEGNPLFLEESVRTLVETQALVGERGAYRLAKADPVLEMPPTVQAILAERIDRLSPEDKLLLQAASVIGQDISFGLLETIAGLPAEELRQGLARLQAAEFVYEARLFPDLAYTFKHALTQEVAYGTLLVDRRRRLHERIVDAIERLYRDRLGEQLDSLAHHALLGERWDKAVPYLHRAGTRALERSAHREAAERFEQALLALQHLPETRATREQALELRLALRIPLAPLGEHSRMLDVLGKAESLADGLGDRRRLGLILSFLTECFWVRGEPARAIETGERALAIATDLGDFAIQVLTTRYMGRVHHGLGEFPRAIDLLRRNLTTLTGDLARQYFGAPVLSSVGSATWLVQCLIEVGAFAEAAAVADSSHLLAEEIARPLDRVHAAFAGGLLHLQRGDLERATAVLQRGLDLVRQWEIFGWLHQIASPLGLAHARAGRISQSLPLLEQAVEEIVARGRLHGQSMHLVRLGEGYALAGRLADADSAAHRGLVLAQERRERGHEAWARWLLGEIAAYRKAPEAGMAESYFHQALVLSEELGMRPLAAHCHLGLGKLYRRTGKAQEAQEHLTRATTMYREMDMRFWLKQAEAEMKEQV